MGQPDSLIRPSALPDGQDLRTDYEVGNLQSVLDGGSGRLHGGLAQERVGQDNNDPE